MELVDVVELSKYRCEKLIQAEIKYATHENFVGRPLQGYHAQATDFALLSPKAAEDLCKIQNHLIAEHNYGLIIYDAYRPKRAVQDMHQWSQQDSCGPAEEQAKAKHYPHILKSELFLLGYVSEDSNHCYGNTVDVFLLDFTTNEIVDLGACYDYLDELSHLTVDAQRIGKIAYDNRIALVRAMEKFGFESYIKEFWHFSHGDKMGREVATPIDIEITPQLKGQGVQSLSNLST